MIKESLSDFLKHNGGKKILFLGREELFTHKELQRFLKKFEISFTAIYEDGIAGVVEHHRLNPIEENISNEAYNASLPIYKLEEFEKLLSGTLVDDEVLMGLKLSQDQKRLYKMLGNTHLSDKLFIKLLGMHQWSDADDDNNDDRGVLITTLRRFLEYTPQEEDLLYSPSTLKKLISQTTNPQLLNALLEFPNYEFMQQNKQWIELREAVAGSHYLDATTIQKLLKYRKDKINYYLAANSTVPLDTLKLFAQMNQPQLNEALAANSSIDDELFQLLAHREEKTLYTLLAYQPISLERLTIVENRGISIEGYKLLSSNTYLQNNAIKRLLEHNENQINSWLAANPLLDTLQIDMLFERGVSPLILSRNSSASPQLLEKIYTVYHDDLEILLALASNSATPQVILKDLFEKDIFTINEHLAINPSLPMEYLNILKIDTRLRNALTKNKTFIENNIRDFEL